MIMKDLSPQPFPCTQANEVHFKSQDLLIANLEATCNVMHICSVLVCTEHCHCLAGADQRDESPAITAEFVRQGASAGR